jgi:signal transduction histidine kinase/ActR/RegA family two-component response regulator
VRARATVRLPDLSDEKLSATCRDDRHFQLMKRIAPGSAIAVPMIARNDQLGAITLAWSRSNRRYGEDDVRLAEDVARRAALAIENARLFQHAQEASRLKDEFLATVGHELRTPLTAILGWTRLLRTGRLSDEKRVRAFDSIERSADAQARLVDDILDISRIVSGRLWIETKAVDLADIVESAVESFRPAAEAKGVTLQVDSDLEVGVVVGDGDRLRQVVWNLLSNAVKFTPKGGQVRVELRRLGGDVELAVVDSGQGISAAFLPYVFERFRQADSSTTRMHGGLGLGLAIVRHLVELHGGTVRGVSEGEGKGATFVVRIPAAGVPALDSAATGDAGAAPISLAGVAVLVVEDQAEARQMIAAMLEQAGAAVQAVSSAKEAIEIVRARCPQILVSDIAMPEQDGFTLIGSIRALEGAGARLPAVALSAYARVEDQRNALAAGFDRHLAKPVDPTALLTAVAALAGERS